MPISFLLWVKGRQHDSCSRLDLAEEKFVLKLGEVDSSYLMSDEEATRRRAEYFREHCRLPHMECLAPEVLATICNGEKTTQYSKASDVYQLGYTLRLLFAKGKCGKLHITNERDLLSF